MATNNKSVRTYELEFKQLLEGAFRTRAYFADFFGGGIEALDGVENNENAFYVKTSDIPVVVGTYDTGENVAFGTGTANSTRFGERTEIVYSNTPVPYTWDWAIHEGIDRHTVNNNLDFAIADRLDLQAQAKIRQFNANHGKFISDSAGHTEELATLDGDGVLALFNKLSNYFVNNEVIGTKVAKVKPELYNVIIDMPQTTVEKHSSANIDENTIVKFKGFEIQEVPDAQFAEGETAYAYVKDIGKAFTGINTARTIESEDFDGVALQGAGKAGEFVLEANKAAIVKVTSGGGGGVEG